MAIERKPWPAFLRWFGRNWYAGEHVILLGPAGRGKTYLAARILPLRRYVVAIDIKGGKDPSLSLDRLDGFVNTSTWPHPKERKLVQQGPLRLRLAPPNDRPEQLPAMRATVRSCLTDVYVRGGWSVYLDECRVVVDPRAGMGLGREVENLILVKRFEGVSVITASQAPRWIPHAAYDQSVHAFFWRNRDREVVKRLAEISGGFDRREIETAVAGLGFHEVLYVGGKDERMIVTEVDR